MILIADSGSTKTDWRLLNGSFLTEYNTSGFNPYFQTTENISEVLKRDLIPEVTADIASKVEEIYYYGAGCSSEEKCSVVHKALQENFINARIEVEHDLLAAARALCGNEPGIAAILGTGSNSCYYDGENIVENVFSLGFILGDEGSGAYLGRELLRTYFYGELNDELAEKFKAQFPESREQVLNKIYKEPLPSRYLASFSRFLYDNLNEPAIIKIVEQSFADFFDRHITKYSLYKTIPLHCVGSIGYNYKQILTKVAQMYGITVGNVIKSPIEALVNFHRKEKVR